MGAAGDGARAGAGRGWWAVCRSVWHGPDRDGKFEVEMLTAPPPGCTRWDGGCWRLLVSVRCGSDFWGQEANAGCMLWPPVGGQICKLGAWTRNRLPPGRRSQTVYALRGPEVQSEVLMVQVRVCGCYHYHSH